MKSDSERIEAGPPRVVALQRGQLILRLIIRLIIFFSNRLKAHSVKCSQ